MQAEWAPYRLDFKFEARTSRERMRHKDTYFVRLTDPSTGRTGVGECALFRGLSADDVPDYEARLGHACASLSLLPPESSIRFGLESALASAAQAPKADSSFMRGEEGIPINGLIWMGDKAEMRCRIDEKLAAGFKVLKLKIGGIGLDGEMELLRYIRSVYSPADLELRLDANGSLPPGEALDILCRLSEYAIHSIEQPLRAGMTEATAELCRRSPVDIALDEELIGAAEPEKLLDTVKPQYIILKPALCGGLSGADRWADLAEARGIGWWATSALESNVGLFAIARWVSGRGVRLPQGLGTGLLYHNNVESPLRLRGQRLYYDPEGSWKMPPLTWTR